MRPLERNRVKHPNCSEREHQWHGTRLNQPDWSEASHSLALCAKLQLEGLWFHLILNAHWEPLEFELPSLASGSSWLRWIDTGLDSPQDIVPWEAAEPVGGPTYRAAPRSVVLLHAFEDSPHPASR